MRKGKANSNFFKNAGGNEFGGGGGAEIVIAAPKHNPNIDYAAQASQNQAVAARGGGGGAGPSGPASQKAIDACLKRAQQTGTLNMQSKGLQTFPVEVCNLHELKLIDNFWEAYELTKVDMSNNEIDSIPEEIANQEVSFLHSKKFHVY